jgi:hypothetical protein
MRFGPMSLEIRSAPSGLTKHFTVAVEGDSNNGSLDKTQSLFSRIKPVAAALIGSPISPSASVLRALLSLVRGSCSGR